MRQRIRSIKPEFFKHYDLYQAEIQSRLPLRLAFESLFTVADREGRFQWRPEELKAYCLPYDQVDFSRVLDALATRGFIRRYESAGEAYGWIPTFLKHQVINNRENPSELPDPLNADTSTRAPRVPHAWSDFANLEKEEREREREREREQDIGAGAPAPEKKPRRPNKSPVPDPFEITPRLNEWARKTVPGVDMFTETQKFIDHHKKKADLFVDWAAAWRLWMRNAANPPWQNAKPRQMTDTVGMSDEPCTDTNPDQIAALRAIHATDDPIQRAAMVAEYNQNYGEEAECR